MGPKPGDAGAAPAAPAGPGGAVGPFTASPGARLHPAPPLLEDTPMATPVPPETVAEIHRLCEGTILSQSAIAREVGVAPSTVHNYLRREGWKRPGEEGAPERGAAGPADLPTLVAECLTLLKRQLATLPRHRTWNRGERMNEALRALSETGRTLKELARIASTFGGLGPAAPAGESLEDDLDDDRFDALCAELARDFLHWRSRRPSALPAREADGPAGA